MLIRRSPASYKAWAWLASNCRLPIADCRLLISPGVPKAITYPLIKPSIGNRQSDSRMHPLGAAVGPVFFLPDRHQFFKAINGVTAGLERLGTVRTTHR